MVDPVERIARVLWDTWNDENERRGLTKMVNPPWDAPEPTGDGAAIAAHRIMREIGRAEARAALLEVSVILSEVVGYLESSATAGGK